MQVSDLGTPRLSAEISARVVIYVDDINDSPPVFDNSSYDANLALPTYQDVVVLSVHATDQDLDNVITYSFVHSNGGEQFSIDSLTGLIRVANVVGLSDHHDLVVRASDSLHDADVEVHIHTRVLNSDVIVVDDKDMLHFSRDFYHAHIAENSTSGVRDLLLLQAVGLSLEEPVHYQILNPCGMFNVGETTGIEILLTEHKNISKINILKAIGLYVIKTEG